MLQHDHILTLWSKPHHQNQAQCSSHVKNIASSIRCQSYLARPSRRVCPRSLSSPTSSLPLRDEALGGGHVDDGSEARRSECLEEASSATSPFERSSGASQKPGTLKAEAFLRTAKALAASKTWELPINACFTQFGMQPVTFCFKGANYTEGPKMNPRLISSSGYSELRTLDLRCFPNLWTSAKVWAVEKKWMPKAQGNCPEVAFF